MLSSVDSEIFPVDWFLVLNRRNSMTTAEAKTVHTEIQAKMIIIVLNVGNFLRFIAGVGLVTGTLLGLLGAECFSCFGGAAGTLVSIDICVHGLKLYKSKCELNLPMTFLVVTSLDILDNSS